MPLLVKNTLSWLPQMQQQRPDLINNHLNLATNLPKIRVAILNLMPTVQTTEQQWAEVLSHHNEALVEIIFINSRVRPSSRVDKQYIDQNYESWHDLDFATLDAIIITGAPVETVLFQNVDYYDEVTQILDKAKQHNLFMLLVCWAAQASLYYFYEVDKKTLPVKLSGVYPHTIKQGKHPLFKDLNPQINICISRQTSIFGNMATDYCNVLMASAVDGYDCLDDKANPRIIYMLNHLEYDEQTLQKEYVRDLQDPSVNVEIPHNYFKHNDITQGVNFSWRQHQIKFFTNWLNWILQQ